jgi:hypothetical protein
MKNMEMEREMVRMDFDSVFQVFDALHCAFDTEGSEHVDERCHALWVLFLNSTGWSEDEFWSALENREDVCPDCGEPLNSHDDDEEVVVDKKNQN